MIQPDPGESRLVQRMAALGPTLRAARERMGASVAEAAAHTGIAARYIAGLESEQFDLLPARVYARAYLRNYADYLHLDPEPLLERLDDLWVEPEAPEVVPVSRPVSIPPIITGQMILVVAFLIILGVLIGYVYTQYSTFGFNQGSAIPTDITPVKPAVTSTAKVPTTTAGAPIAAGSTPATKPAPSTPAAGGEAAMQQPTAAPTATAPPPTNEMTLEIRVTQRAWMSVEVDGKEVLNATIEPGATHKWTAKERIFIWCGFAGGVRVIRNGVDEGPLGSGVVKTVWAAPNWKATPVN